MINQQLVDYIKQQMQAGVSKDAVRKALGDAGWPPADVDDSLRSAEPAGGPAGASSASQSTINPVAAMGGTDTMASASSAAKPAVATSSSDKFFSKPAAATASKMAMDDDDEDHPPVKKLMIAMAAMGVVILLLAGALTFVYFNMSSQLEAAQGGAPADPAQLSALQQQVTQLGTEKNDLTAQVQTLTAENQAFTSEMGFFIAPASSSTAPASATVKGMLSGNASTTFVLTTAHSVKVLIANSKDAKVSAALTPLANGTSSVTLAGTHPVGSANLSVTSVNGAPL